MNSNKHIFNNIHLNRRCIIPPFKHMCHSMRICMFANNLKKAISVRNRWIIFSAYCCFDAVTFVPILQQNMHGEKRMEWDIMIFDIFIYLAYRNIYFTFSFLMCFRKKLTILLNSFCLPISYNMSYTLFTGRAIKKFKQDFLQTYLHKYFFTSVWIHFNGTIIFP